MTTFKLEAGRNIYRDGKPFIAIMRCGDTTACEADEATREIAATVYRCDYNGPIADKYEGAKKNAEGWYQSIQELVARLNSEDASDQEAAREEIQDGPLSVLVRDGWRQPGQAADEGAEDPLEHWRTCAAYLRQTEPIRRARGRRTTGAGLVSAPVQMGARALRRKISRHPTCLCLVLLFRGMRCRSGARGYRLGPRAAGPSRATER
jgi:hypothetical protein